MPKAVFSNFFNLQHQEYIDKETTIYNLEEPGFSHSANFVKGDVRDAERLARAINGHEIILHLAARYQNFGIGRSEYMNTNEGGARTVVQAVNKVGIKRLVFFSSVGVYGDRESEIRGRRSEDRGRKSEVRGRRSEIGRQRSENEKTEIRDQRSEVGERKDRCQRTKRQRSEVGGRRSKNQDSCFSLTR